MQVFHTTRRIIVTCTRRLAPWLTEEIHELGYETIRSFSTGAELCGTLDDCIRLNLNLFTASQVLYSLKEFEAANPARLYKELINIPWEEIIPADGYFTITSVVNNETISTPLFANVKVKDAIADRFREKTGARPNSGPKQDRTVIHLYWNDDHAEVFIDTSGESLTKHGYRKFPGKAPLQETLAASLIRASKWDRKSTFVNPMCGSGTLAIEAALLAINKRPGMFRLNYAFMHVLGYDEQVFFAERRKLKDLVQKTPAAQIIATDYSNEAIDIARKNAQAAGVEPFIEFRVCDFFQTPVPTGPGVVIFNPEYGERLGIQAKLQEAYNRIGDFLKQKCGGYRGYVFTGSPDLARVIGLKAAKRMEFFNGKLDCRLLEYELYEGSRRTSSAT
jgi:putative N6-adenine-specific DNA methylase